MSEKDEKFREVFKTAGKMITAAGKKVSRPICEYKLNYGSCKVSISNYLDLTDRTSAAYAFIMKLDDIDIIKHRGGKNHEVILSLEDFMQAHGIKDEDEAGKLLDEIGRILVGVSVSVRWEEKDEDGEMSPCLACAAFVSSFMPHEGQIYLSYTPSFWELVKYIPKKHLHPAFIECVEKMYRK